jgi:Protein of unknown function (DUF1559)
MTGRQSFLHLGRSLLLFGLPLLALTALPHPASRAEDDPEPRGLYPKTTDNDRITSANNLKHVGLGMHGYHDIHSSFPAAAIQDKNGKALLSWRVAILPFIEEENLYREFKLDEPWDNKHNKKLIAKMPKIYAPPIQGKPAKANTTYYQVFTGPDAAFNLKAALGPKVTDVKDGVSHTAMVVEAGQAVIWTKPDDVAYDAKKPLPKLGGLFKEGFHVITCDGAVRFVGRQAKVAQLRALITPSGGEFFAADDLPAPQKKK